MPHFRSQRWPSLQTIYFMENLKVFIQARCSLYKFLPILLVAMTFLVTGCPQTEYIVELKPQGNSIERTLVFYCVDGVNTNTGLPNYQSFDPDEFAIISAIYPTQGLTNAGKRYAVRGNFTNELPNDVGGAGVFTNVTTSLGSAGFYVERFRGNDDLAGMDERRYQAADQLVDIIVGWSRKELGREPGYDKLRKFMDVDFRRDLKNFSSYGLALQRELRRESRLVGGEETMGTNMFNAFEGYYVRLGQYLLERGYFKIGEIPGLVRDFSSGDPNAILQRIQRLLVRKMGLPDTAPIPPLLANLASVKSFDKLGKSFNEHLAGTELYRAKLKQWEKDKKLNPGIEKPKPSKVWDDAAEQLLEFKSAGSGSAHLVVHLSLPAAPVHSNGRWNNTLKQVLWDTRIGGRTNTTDLPVSCYASWVEADETFQKEHLGKVALTRDELMEYCLWCSNLDPKSGAEWDVFLTSLKPGDGLTEKIDAFRFSGESNQAGTNQPQVISSLSSDLRSLLTKALN